MYGTPPPPSIVFSFPLQRTNGRPAAPPLRRRVLPRLEPRLESPPVAASPQLVTLETEASLLSSGIGMPSVGGGVHGNAVGGGGGSNMVSRDDTSAMLRLVAQWLRGEVAELSRRAADRNMSMAERGRVVRALLHSLGVLAVFFRCASCTHVSPRPVRAVLI